MDMPPSTLSVAPVTNELWSLARNSMARATSSGMGTTEGPIIGAFVLFGLQEALSSYGAWYLVIVGGLAVAGTLVASRGLWGLASERFG